MRILVLDTVDPVLISGLRNLGFDIKEDYQSSQEDVMLQLNGIHGIVIRSRFPIDSVFIDATHDLKFIARVGAGMENIDQDAASARGIELIKAPEGNRDAVGEHAVGMLLMLLNNLARADREVREGSWRREPNRGYELQGKTVGVIGYGFMGSAFVEKLKGFGVKVMVYDKYKSGFGTDFIREVGLDELKKEAEIVSIHTPLTEETRHMVNEEFLDSFRNNIYLINTARGRIVDTRALVNGLQSGKVSGACLDVLEYEKTSFEGLFSGDMPEAFRFLIQSEKVVLSPHIAGWSFESNRKMAEVILEKIKKLQLG